MLLLVEKKQSFDSLGSMKAIKYHLWLLDSALRQRLALFSISQLCHLARERIIDFQVQIQDFTEALQQLLQVHSSMSQVNLSPVFANLDSFCRPNHTSYGGSLTAPSGRPIY